jgi:hypothetical protein
MKLIFSALSLAALMALTWPAQADTRFGKKGTLAVAGGAGLMIQNHDVDKPDNVPQGAYKKADLKTFTLNFAPTVGLFIIDGLMIGVTPFYRINKKTSKVNGNKTETDSERWGLAGAVRYYYPIKGTLFVNGGARLGYVGDDNAIIGSGGQDNHNGFGFGLNGGVTIAFGGKFGGFVSALATFDYAMLSAKKKFASDRNDLDLGLMTELGIFF